MFHDFDPAAMAAMTERDIDRAAQDPRAIRNRRKISESVESAAAASEVIAEHGSFDAFLRSFGSPDEEIDDLRDRFPAWATSRPGGSCSRSGCRSRRPTNRYRSRRCK